jgi:hypothetical protein
MGNCDLRNESGRSACNLKRFGIEWQCLRSQKSDEFQMNLGHKRTRHKTVKQIDAEPTLGKHTEQVYSRNLNGEQSFTVLSNYFCDRLNHDKIAH